MEFWKFSHDNWKTRKLGFLISSLHKQQGNLISIITPSYCSMENPALITISVLIATGLTQLTRTLFGPSSSAVVLVNWSTAALESEYVTESLF